MLDDLEIKMRGVKILRQKLGFIEMERFIGLINRESYDYTARRESEPYENIGVEEYSRRAMEYVLEKALFKQKHMSGYAHKNYTKRNAPRSASALAQHLRERRYFQTNNPRSKF